MQFHFQFSAIALTFEPISQISSSKPAWNIKARVVRLWKVSDFNRNTLPFSIEMVLMDSEVFIFHLPFYIQIMMFFLKLLFLNKLNVISFNFISYQKLSFVLCLVLIFVEI